MAWIDMSRRLQKRSSAWELAGRRIATAAIALVLSLSATSRAEDGASNGHQACSDRCEPAEWLSGEAPLLSVDSPLGEVAYRAGRGLRVGDTGLNIGGFTTLEFDRAENGEGELELDSLSFLLLWEPDPRFRLFAELDIDSLYAYETEGSESRSNPQTSIERVYGELRLADEASLRLGKFQTPVGRWNLVPAEPFVWTASSPVIVEEGFDSHQTGGAVLGTLHRRAGSLEYWVYGQATDQLDASEDPPPADHGVGGRLQWNESAGRWSVGGSYLATEIDGNWSHLAGADAELTLRPLALTSELTLVRGDGPERDLWGAYLQGVLDVGCGFYLVARYEYFDPVADDDASILDAGVAWTPLPWLRLKADYRLSSRETDAVTRGVSTSVSIVF